MIASNVCLGQSAHWEVRSRDDLAGGTLGNDMLNDLLPLQATPFWPVTTSTTSSFWMNYHESVKIYWPLVRKEMLPTRPDAKHPAQCIWY